MKVVVAVAELEEGDSATVVDLFGAVHILNSECSEIVIDIKPAAVVSLLPPIAQAPVTLELNEEAFLNPHGEHGAIIAPDAALDIPVAVPDNSLA